MEAAFWDARYADLARFAYGEAPNAFIAEAASRLLHAPTTVVDLASGEGRNAVYLAKAWSAGSGGHGHDTTCGRKQDTPCALRPWQRLQALVEGRDATAFALEQISCQESEAVQNWLLNHATLCLHNQCRLATLSQLSTFPRWGCLADGKRRSSVPCNTQGSAAFTCMFAWGRRLLDAAASPRTTTCAGAPLRRTTCSDVVAAPHSSPIPTGTGPAVFC